MPKGQRGGFKKKLCGSPHTKRGVPCRQTTAPCPFHDEDGNPRKTQKGHPKDRIRREKLADGLMRGESIRKAATEAGYSKSTMKSRIYAIVETEDVQKMIATRRAQANVETNEIIGTLVSHMRGDLYDIFPNSEILAEARKNGVSHLVTQIEVEERYIPSPDEDGEPIKVVKTKLRIQDQGKGAERLAKIFGMEQLPAPNEHAMRQFHAAVEDYMQTMADAGHDLTLEQAQSDMAPFFKKLINPVPTDAVN